MTRLVRAYPGNIDAILALAQALELEGNLEGDRPESSALQTARKAREMARTTAEYVRSAAIDVRILIKLQQFDRARKEARAVLRKARGASDSEVVDALASLAALVGEPQRVADEMWKLASHDASDPHLPNVGYMLETRRRLMAYAAMGAPIDSIRIFADRLEFYAMNHLGRSTLETLGTCELLGRPQDLAFPVLLKAIEDSTCWTGADRRAMQAALARGDTARVGAIMDRVDATRGNDEPPGELAIDVVFQESWLLNQAGYASRAARQLDRSLDALRSFNLELLHQFTQAAALVRAMALRADIAAASGDTDKASRWAAVVEQLWHDTDDPDLEDVVRRMHTLARDSR